MKLEAGAVTTGPTHLVHRPRLTRLLDETSARVILLVAPAGYGKTTLAHEWLSRRKHVWYRGNSGSADVAALALGLARAAAAIVPAADERLATRLRLARPSSSNTTDLAEILADDLKQWPDDAWLAFDDYHFACDSEPAERFVEHLVASTSIRLLVASRSRPHWASARRLIYGEAFELGRNLLAMNRTEADTILRSRSSQEVQGLIALADGWPALLGLAALPSEPHLGHERPPSELYSYFADELYQALPQGDQSVLRLLSLAPAVTPEVTQFVGGDSADRAVQRALNLGFFLASPKPPRLELHPLLRSFLISKFTPHEDDPNGLAVSRLIALLLKEEEWDEAFDLIERFFTPVAFIELVEVALPRMLDEARLPTLRRWVQLAHIHHIDSPLFDFIEAEIALPNGEWKRAEALALQAARRLPGNHTFRSKAFWLAGTSTHMLFEGDVALRHFADAADSAASSDDEKQALWGRFMTNAKLDNAQEAALLLDDLASRSSGTADELLRLATGRLNLASLLGRLQEALDEAELAAPLAAKSRNPLIQSSFLHAHSALLALSGRYNEALGTAKSSLDVATSYRLIFPIAYAQFELGVAYLGLRDFRSCRSSLAAAEKSAIEGGDTFLHMNLVATWARLHLALAVPARALDLLERHQHLASSQSMKGEYLAWWSLAAALEGDPKQARALAKRAEGLTQRLDVTGLIPWTSTVVSLKTNRSVHRSFETAWRGLSSTGNVDAFITAYRACPYLLDLAKADISRRDQLRVILERAQDHKLAEHVGLPLPASPIADVRAILSRREREVLDLVSEGLMNKEIGRALFITEATVKAHVRKICRKLGVRSRTEAAMRAAEFSD